MIYLRLAGGLGNQLFQLAAALAVQRDSLRQRVILIADGLDRYETKRSFDLARLLELDRLGVDMPPRRDIFARTIDRARLGRWLPAIGLNDRTFGKRIGARSVPSMPISLLDGYFQSAWTWHDFSPIVERLRNSLAPGWKTPTPLSKTCAIHVRGGDFLKHPLHQVVDADYYASALGLVRERQRVDRVLVVTDDCQHANVILESTRVRHPDLHFEQAPNQPDPLVDFRTLVGASSRVIGNSTFSWWASIFDARESITVSPSVFVRGQPRHIASPWEIPLSVRTDG